MAEAQPAAPWSCLECDTRGQPLSCSRALRRYILKARPSIVHVHSFFGLLVERLAFPIHRPHRLVATLHNQGYLSWPASTAYQKLRKRVHGWLLCHVDRLTAVSQSVFEHYREQFPLRDITVIPNSLPVDIEARMNAKSPASRLTWPPRRIVIPGRITREKGHGHALRALATLEDLGPDWTLVILGDGPLLSELRAQVFRSGMSNRVQFGSLQSREAFIDVFQSADLCLLPSISEGFGIVALESMALGVPVVASAQGGLAELVRHEQNGWLVPPADVNALASRLAQIFLSTEAPTTLVSEARKTASTFSIARVGKDWRRLYRELRRH